MKRKLLRIFLYFHIYSGAASAILFLPFAFVAEAIGIPDEVILSIIYCLAGVFVWSAFVVTIFAFLCIAQDPELPLQKAEKLVHHTETFEVLARILRENLTQQDYHPSELSSSEDPECIEIYSKRETLGAIKCVTVARISELDTNYLEHTSDEVQKFLKSYFRGHFFANRLVMVSFFCVDRVTPAFYNVISKSQLTNFKVRYLPIGISFGGKKVYIANPKKHPRWYKAAREEVLQLLSGIVDTTDAEST